MLALICSMLLAIEANCDVNEDDDVDENDGDVEDVDVSNLVCMSSSPSAPPAIASAAIITFEES